MATSCPDPGGSPLEEPFRDIWVPSPARGTCGAGRSFPLLQTPWWGCAGLLGVLPLPPCPAAPCAAPSVGSCDGETPCASYPGSAAYLGWEARAGWKIERWAATSPLMREPTVTREPACPVVDEADQPKGGLAGSAWSLPWTVVAGVDVSALKRLQWW